jgi:hypothetical protein
MMSRDKSRQRVLVLPGHWRLTSIQRDNAEKIHVGRLFADMKGTPFMSAFFCAFPLDREVIQEYSLNKHMNKCSYNKTKKKSTELSL